MLPALVETGDEGRRYERGGSSALMAKCSLAYTSQKLKYDPALLKQFSFEKLHILPAVLQLQRAGLIGLGCFGSTYDLGLSLVFLFATEMLYA